MIQTYLNRRKKCLNHTNINDLPNDLLEEIFFYLSGNDLCKKLVLVCKKWLNIIENETFWKLKCLYNTKISRKSIQLINSKENAKKIYFYNMFNRNLIKNSNCSKSFDYWYLLCNSNDFKFNNNDSNNDQFKMIITKYYQKCARLNTSLIQKLTNQLVQITLIENDAINSIENNLKQQKTEEFIFFGEKIQVIDLEAEGINEIMFNQIKPDIEITTNAMRSLSIETLLTIKIILISKNFDLINSFTVNSSKKLIKHRLKYDSLKYPVRFIIVYHCEKKLDNNSDIKTSNSFLKIII
jgi:hypothetical protein